MSSIQHEAKADFSVQERPAGVAMTAARSVSAPRHCSSPTGLLRLSFTIAMTVGLALVLSACSDKEKVVREGVAFYCEVDRLQEAIRAEPERADFQEELRERRERFEAQISRYRLALQIELQERIEARYQRGECP